MKKTNKKGFTLVELLVVIAIIAILSVVSIVGYTSFTKRAKESNAMTELSQVTTYMYAATAIADSGITLNEEQNGFDVVITDASTSADAISKATAKILAQIDDLNARTKVSLKEAGCATFTPDDDNPAKDDVVTVQKLYYTYADGIVAVWDVATNKLSIAE